MFKVRLTEGCGAGEEEKAEFSDEFFARRGDTEILGGRVSVEVKKRERQCDEYKLDIAVRGVVRLTCDRCLGEMEQEIANDEVVVVKHGDVEEQEENEDGTEITIGMDRNDVDLGSHLYDTIVLNVPLRHVHGAGQCDEKMARRLAEYSAGTAKKSGRTDERWQKLEDLVVKKNK